MGDKTGIEWTDATWNPTTGCDRVSPGCDHCYALTMAKRLKGMGQPDYQVDGDPRTSGPGFGFQMHPHRLDQPLRWTRSRRIFVNSMSDLFHQHSQPVFIAEVWARMAATPRHTYQVLTKRPGKMRSLLSSPEFVSLVVGILEHRDLAPAGDYPWPLPNVWVGTSVEDQQRADLRIPYLLGTPAAVRFLSCEPLLGHVNLFPYLGVRVNQSGDRWEHGSIDWVIAGGESGREARPVHPDWVRSIRDECVGQGVAFHFKQWGEWVPEDQAPADAVVPSPCRWNDATGTYRLGKHKAGRELDGRTWDEWPS